MKYKHLTLIAGIHFFFISEVFSQYSYSAGQSSQAYVELQNPIVIPDAFSSTGWAIDLQSLYTVFGQSFAMDGVHGLRISTEFGALLGYSNQNDTIFSIDGFLSNGFLVRDSTSGISYEVTSSTFGDLVKVQWKNVTISGGNPATDSLNFQIWLHQSGQAEVHIGPIGFSTSPSNLFFGLPGPGIGIFLSDPSFATVHETLFLTGSPSNVSENRTTLFANLNGIPENGQVFVFDFNGLSLEEESRRPSIGIYSTPGNKSVEVETRNVGSGKLVYEVTDMSGAILESMELITDGGIHTQTLDFSQISSGIYILSVYSNDRLIGREKIGF